MILSFSITNPGIIPYKPDLFEIHKKSVIFQTLQNARIHSTESTSRIVSFTAVFAGALEAAIERITESTSHKP